VSNAQRRSVQRHAFNLRRLHRLTAVAAAGVAAGACIAVALLPPLTWIHRMDPGSAEAANLVTTGCIVPREHRSEENDDERLAVL
jgi:hypothetical protein